MFVSQFSRRMLSIIAMGMVVLTAGSLKAGDVPTRFFDGAAREIAASLQAGNGWCVVSSRAQVQLASIGSPVDCVRYRVVKGYKISTTSNDQVVVDLQYAEETSWIAVDLKMPTASGPSLTAAKAANEAVGMLDTILPQLEAALAAEEDAALKSLGQEAIGSLRAQRSALVDLIQKDIGAVEMAQ